MKILSSQIAHFDMNSNPIEEKRIKWHTDPFTSELRFKVRVSWKEKRTENGRLQWWCERRTWNEDTKTQILFVPRGRWLRFGMKSASEVVDVVKSFSDRARRKVLSWTIRSTLGPPGIAGKLLSEKRQFVGMPLVLPSGCQQYSIIIRRPQPILRFTVLLLTRISFQDEV